MNYLTEEKLNSFISAALSEDIGEGDHTTLSSIAENASGTAKLLIKDDGILAGIDLAERIFRQVDSGLQLNIYKKDGDKIKKGELALEVEGSIRSILQSERLVLNCMQRMSGIATYTNYLTNLISGTKAKLLDTRKTTPNFRMMEKWAVAIGGGVNHRFGLYDMILLKDNHVDFAGGIKNAIFAANNYLKKNNLSLNIEIETRSIAEVKEALEAGGITRIMLDNMNVATMKDAVDLISGRYETEASGGITEENIVEIAKTGVDYISSGALTHSYKSLDLSLKASIKK